MFRAIDKWLPGYLASVFRRPGVGDEPMHLVFCLADHYEPFRLIPGGTGGHARDGEARDAARAIVDRWVREYPCAVAGFRDADGRPPRHTFFYPQEEYDPACLDALGALCRGGWGEVEVQLHHRNDTPDGFRAKLERFRDALAGHHSLLGRDRGGRPRFGFVHGNWALCNSRPDGDWCGVNEELAILAGTGCYADFTFPSAPSPTQPRTVNAIYRATDRPGRARGGDRGQRTEVRGQGAAEGRHGAGRMARSAPQAPHGEESEDERSSSYAMPSAPCPLPADSLLLITGPLGLDWRRRKWGLLPRLENGAITGANPPTAARARLWLRQHIHVAGRPDWVFVKVHTHGGVAENAAVLLGDAMRRFHDGLIGGFNRDGRWALHYVTAREMYNIIRAAEDGRTGDPGQYRDYEILPPL